MRNVPGGLGILLLSAVAIFGVAAEADIPVVDAPDSLVFRDPFVDRSGVVLEEVVVDAPDKIVLRDMFIARVGTVLTKSIEPPVNIAFRPLFVARDGVVNDTYVAPPNNIVFRDIFVSRAGVVTKQDIDPPEGLVFRYPFVNSSGEVTDSFYSSVPEAPPAKLISLRGIYPNPFNPAAQISFYLRDASEVEVVVLDLRGRLVRSLFQGQLAADLHVLHWNGLSDAGRQVASGQYLFRISADNEVVNTKGLLIK
ncbi:MAG: T9SS type A sorting domain-containing protein [Gemmatimonadales bacterium]|nr:T9SS type A sorting domain-containing protein [Gemmatimonadales bacterium]